MAELFCRVVSRSYSKLIYPLREAVSNGGWWLRFEVIMGRAASRFFLVTISIFALAESAFAAGRGAAEDVTDEFRATWETVAGAGEVSAEILKLREFHVIFVSGFLADAGAVLGLRPAFNQQRRALDGYGISNSLAEIQTAGRVATNAELVASAIAAAVKPVLLITYSKGSLDSLEALRLHPELIAKVPGWWMLQSPIFGTPVANYARASGLPIAVADLVDLIGGDSAAVADMTLDVRAEYMRAHADFFSGLPAQIKILSFAAWKKNSGFFRWDTDFKPIRDFMLNFDGMENDGLVPWKSAIFPGSDFVALEGVDHVAAVHSSRWIEFDRLRFTCVLLKMLGKRLIQ